MTQKSRAPFYQRRRREMAHQLPLTHELSPYGRDGWTPDHWATPWPLVRALEEEFGPFELDPCASAENAKAPRYFSEAENGLAQPWAPARVFLNAPYSDILPWIRKAAAEARAGALVVALVPVRTDRDWWHDILAPAAEIRFQRGRQRFIGPDGTTTGRPVFASAVCIFRPAAQAPVTAPTSAVLGVAWEWLRRWRFGPLPTEAGYDEQRERALADLVDRLRPGAPQPALGGPACVRCGTTGPHLREYLTGFYCAAGCPDELSEAR